MTSEEVFELANKLMDYDNCTDFDIDKAAEVLRQYAEMLAINEVWAWSMVNKMKNSPEIDLNKDQQLLYHV